MYIDHNPLLTEAITELTDFNFLIMLTRSHVLQWLHYKVFLTVSPADLQDS